MRYLGFAIGLATVSSTATAQDSVWGFFELEDGGMGAGVQNEDGAQLLIKCDKKGEGEVYAAVNSHKNLTPPFDSYQRRDVRLRFDGGSPVESSWRYYQTSALATNLDNETALERLLDDLVDATEFEIQFDPIQSRKFKTEFNVTGVREALAIVYERCSDTNPFG